MSKGVESTKRMGSGGNKQTGLEISEDLRG